MGEGTQLAEVQYLVLPDSVNPYLLARVRWPDVAQAISPELPHWQYDPGLFDLPYDPSSATVTFARAASIATSWGADIATDPTEPVPTLIRRMPANWSYLSGAERDTWRLGDIKRSGPARRTDRKRWFVRRSSRPQLHSTMDRAISESISPSSNGTSTPEPAGTERRGHPRMRVVGRLEINCGQESIRAALIDVSYGGVHCILTQRTSIPEVGGKLGSPLLIEDQTTKTQISLDVVSSVAWFKDISSGTQLGVAFSELDRAQLDQIERFLATFRKARFSQ
jgi:hypothetical protein